MMSIIMIGMVVAVSLVQCFRWYRAGKYAAALVGLVFSIVYLVDLMVIGTQQSLTLTASIQGGSVDRSDWHIAVALVVLTWISFSFFVSVFPRSKRAGIRELGPAAEKSNFKPSFVAYIFLSSIAVVGVLVPVLRVGIADALSLRQQVFGDGVVGLLGYFLAPVLFVYGFLLLKFHKGAVRFLLYLVLAGNLFATFLTGSRTGLFLTAVLPVLALIWRRIRRTSRDMSSDLKRISLVLAACLVPLFGGSWYLSKARGVSATTESDGSLFNSVDISQADVLVALIGERVAGVSQTYIGSVLTFFPREWWEGKPLSGNAITSMVLAPDRYQTTNSEITAGVLGEAYINIGIYAPITAGLILALFCWLCDRLLSNSNDLVWTLGLIVVLRGLNLVRGDLANIVTPTVLAIIAWWVIFGRFGFKKRKCDASVHLAPFHRAH